MEDNNISNPNMNSVGNNNLNINNNGGSNGVMLNYQMNMNGIQPVQQQDSIPHLQLSSGFGNNGINNMINSNVLNMNNSGQMMNMGSVNPYLTQQFLMTPTTFPYIYNAYVNPMNNNCNIKSNYNIGLNNMNNEGLSNGCNNNLLNMTGSRIESRDKDINVINLNDINDDDNNKSNTLKVVAAQMILHEINKNRNQLQINNNNNNNSVLSNNNSNNSSTIDDHHLLQRQLQFHFQNQLNSQFHTLNSNLIQSTIHNNMEINSNNNINDELNSSNKSQMNLQPTMALTPLGLIPILPKVNQNQPNITKHQIIQEQLQQAQKQIQNLHNTRISESLIDNDNENNEKDNNMRLDDQQDKGNEDNKQNEDKYQKEQIYREQHNNININNNGNNFYQFQQQQIYQQLQLFALAQHQQMLQRQQQMKEWALAAAYLNHQHQQNLKNQIQQPTKSINIQQNLQPISTTNTLSSNQTQILDGNNNISNKQVDICDSVIGDELRAVLGLSASAIRGIKLNKQEDMNINKHDKNINNNLENSFDFISNINKEQKLSVKQSNIESKSIQTRKLHKKISNRNISKNSNNNKLQASNLLSIIENERILKNLQNNEKTRIDEATIKNNVLLDSNNIESSLILRSPYETNRMEYLQFTTETIPILVKDYTPSFSGKFAFIPFPPCDNKTSILEHSESYANVGIFQGLRSRRSRNEISEELSNEKNILPINLISPTFFPKVLKSIREINENENLNLNDENKNFDHFIGLKMVVKEKLTCWMDMPCNIERKKAKTGLGPNTRESLRKELKKQGEFFRLVSTKDEFLCDIKMIKNEEYSELFFNIGNNIIQDKNKHQDKNSNANDVNLTKNYHKFGESNHISLIKFEDLKNKMLPPVTFHNITSNTKIENILISNDITPNRKNEEIIPENLSTSISSSTIEVNSPTRWTQSSLDNSDLSGNRLDNTVSSTPTKNSKIDINNQQNNNNNGDIKNSTDESFESTKNVIL